MAKPRLIPWPHPEPPVEEAVDRLLRNEGLAPLQWSNGPGERYAVHSHPYHRVLYCLRGSIRFDLAGRSFDLTPGDRLDIPAGIAHSAQAGANGVACFEAARN